MNKSKEINRTETTSPFNVTSIDGAFQESTNTPMKLVRRMNVKTPKINQVKINEPRTRSEVS